MTLRLDPHLAEVFGVAERLEHRSPEVLAEVDEADDPVVEHDLEAMPVEWAHADDGRNHLPILRQWRDRYQRLAALRASPVLDELGPVQLGPLVDEPERAGRERAADHGQVGDRDQATWPAYPAWKCGGWWSFQYSQTTIP